MFAIASAIVLAIASKALAAPSPLTPVTSNVGADCVISWSPDTTGKWTKTNIQLMTGDNWNMVPITTITTVDTTSAAATTFTWKCPDVSPNAPIYFYQFSHAEEPTALQWTTRFTIAGADGSTEPAENDTEPDGTNVPWGIGALADPSEAVPAPAYITGQGPSTANPSVSSSGAASMTMSMPSASVTLSTSRIVSSAARSSTSAAASRVVSSTASAAAATGTNAGDRTTPSKNVALAFGALAAAGLLAMA